MERLPVRGTRVLRTRRRRFLDYTYVSRIVDARQARREARQKLIYDKLHDALDTNDLSMVKKAWGIKNTDEDLDSKALPRDRHPGDVAIEIVNGLLAQYRINGDTRVRYAGMDRKAGRGGHGLSEGTIFVEAELKPMRGQTAYLEFPIIVKASRLQVPGVMSASGVPMLISQAAFDDIMKRNETRQEDFLSQYDPREHVAPKSGKNDLGYGRTLS